jgi:predicted transcriptional regulator
MKNKSIFLILVLLTTIGYSQTNRYSNVSTGTFTPILDPSYYQALGKQKQEQIAYRIEELEKLTTESLKLNIDNEFRENIYEVRRYLAKLDEDMSLSDAEWYINTATKLYNKGVRKYNRRLEK